MVEFELLAGWAVCEWYVIVGNVVEEVDLFLFKKESSGNGVDRSIPPTFVEESTVFVQSVEVIGVRLRPEPVEVSDFEVGPLGG